jgi:ribonuclease-3
MSRSKSDDDRLIAQSRWAESKLTHKFLDDSLLQLALTHSSASSNNNERLEFLGDSLLNFFVANRLFRDRLHANEGDLSRGRAALVNKNILAEIGRTIRLDEHLILGSGELRSGGAHRSAALADAVEALIGAIFLDGGFEAARVTVEHLLAAQLANLPDAAELKDPKTRLQELLQGRSCALPIYSVDAISGSDHKRQFTVACEVTEYSLRAVGHGSSRRGAEQDAAEKMLVELGDGQ